jgi:chemotaxis protein CheX
MIFGQAKIVFDEKGYGINTAIPSVISVKNQTLQAFTKGPVVLIPFSSSAGSFFVEICISA